MRRKINQKGALLAAFAIGVAGFFVGKVILDATNLSLYGILRSLCIFIDTQVYSLSAFAYKIFYEVSSSSILSSLNLSDASQRLYTLLGIFMLFRLAFSFVKYIINPEGMEKGTSKLLTNLAVSLALIVSVPWIFNRAFALQNYIMDSNVIGNLIMGMDTSKDTDAFNAASYGQTIGFLTFSAFYRVDSSIPAYSSCGNLLSYYSPRVIPVGDKEVGIDESYDSDDQGEKESEKIVACVNALNGIGNETSISYKNGSQPAELGTLLYIASQRQDMGILTNSSLLQAVVGDTYLIQYSVIVSTIAGGFLALLFLNFSFDVAVRNAKLCFLQLIAPIPIILNIEPGDTKGDKRSLNWWAKECLHTYALLFIRVATVYFGVFLINVLFGSLSSTFTDTSTHFQIFMILSILLFVKEIPDMIGKAFGIDVKGQFNLNPLKRIGDSKLASMAVGGTAGLIGGGIGSAFSAGISAHRNGASVGESIRRGLTGGVGGGLHSAVSGAKTGAKSIHDITSNATKNWQRSGRIGGANVGTTLGGRLGSRVSMTMGAKTAYQREEDNAVALEMPGKKLSEIKSIMNGDKTKVSTGVTIGSGTRSFNSLEEIDDFLSNNSQLTDADRSNVMKARTTLAGKRGKNPSVSVSLAGRSFNNVKDVYDHLERLKASGASADAIEDAEDKLNIIQGQRWNDAISSANASKKPNVYSLNRDELVEIYEQNQKLYQTHVTDASGKPITNFDNWGNLKTAAGSGKLGSGAVRQGARQAKLNDDAAKARRGGG